MSWGLRLHHEVLFENDELDAAVLGAAFFGVIGGDGTVLTIAHGHQNCGVDAASNQLVWTDSTRCCDSRLLSADEPVESV